MKSYKVWKELAQVTPATTDTNETPTQEDFDFYHTKLSGNLKRYLDWLTGELEESNGKLSTVRKGFIMQEVMDALGLNAGQVTRLSNNIKKGFAAWQAAQRNMKDGERMVEPGRPAVPGSTAAITS